MASKDKEIQALERAWAELRSTVESVPEEELAAAGVVEDWSVKDILGHIAFWSERAALTLRAAAAGKPEDVPRGEGPNWVDEWNAREYAARKDRSYKEIRGDWLTAHENVRKALADTPEEKLGEKLGKATASALFAGDTYEHYDEHAAQIKSWLLEMETTEK